MKHVQALESEVRSYCRSWPTTFTTATGSTLHDADGRRYLDFFSGAGALNYGHNHPVLKEALLAYLTADGVTHSLDMVTEAKERFLARLEERILAPRSLDYRVQFPGPTGTNSVEAALKLARKVTGRERVVSFTNSFHGMTLGSLSVTGNSMKRGGAGVGLTAASSMPFDGFLGPDVDTVELLRAFLDDGGSGLDQPGAVILETVQAEGGINVASGAWLRDLAGLCREFEILLIVDDVQAGCGRTGPFFSFEDFGVHPDIVCLSKSLSGYGLPFAVTLLRPELDVWEPGEHNGTFRGHNPAFVTAAAALDHFWADDALTRSVRQKGKRLEAVLDHLVEVYPELEGEVRGRGLLLGIACGAPEVSAGVVAAAFERGLIVETSGAEGQVVKTMPPLVIADDELEEGLRLLDAALASALDVAPRADGELLSTAR